MWLVAMYLFPKTNKLLSIIIIKLNRFIYGTERANLTSLGPLLTIISNR